MKKLFWGVFFIYLHFNLNLNGHRLNLLPDFVGFILLTLGAGEMAEESAAFKRSRPFAVGLAVYAALSWTAALLSVTAEGRLPVVTELLGLAAMLLTLYVGWLLSRGVLEVETRRETDWGGKTLLSRWKLLACVQVVNRALSLLAMSADRESVQAAAYILVAAMSIVGMVCIILYLLSWYRVWTASEGSGKEKTAETSEEQQM